MQNLNFKKISARENIYTEGGYVANRAYIFKSDWLESVKNKTNRQLRTRATKSKLETVTTKMQGGEVVIKGVAEVVGAVDLDAFKEVSLENCKPVQGFERGQADKYGLVAMQFRVSGKSVCIDKEFYPALTWDEETKIFIRNFSDPIVLVKNSEIVGMIAPLNLKQK